MSKKFCMDSDVLADKVKGRKKRYICSNCKTKSPKEKWCCKPMEIKR